MPLLSQSITQEWKRNQKDKKEEKGRQMEKLNEKKKEWTQDRPIQWEEIKTNERSNRKEENGRK